MEIEDLLSDEGISPFLRSYFLARLFFEGKGIVADELYEEVEKEWAKCEKELAENNKGDGDEIDALLAKTGSLYLTFKEMWKNDD